MSTAVGALLGLAWAAALRAWMVELAGPESAFTWWTVWLVLAPGAAIGAVAGWAVSRRRYGAQVPGRAGWSIALLGVAVLEPSIFRALITNGQGSGALLVAGAGAAGGVVLSRRGWSVGRALALLGWAFGVVSMLALSTIAPGSAGRGLLVSVSGAGLVVALGFGAALTRRPGLVIGRPGRIAAVACVAATWLATVALSVTHGWTWAEVVDGPLPLAVWAVALVAGLAGSVVVALRHGRALLA